MCFSKCHKVQFVKESVMMVYRIFLNEFNIIDVIQVYYEKEILYILEQATNKVEYN